MHKNDGTFIPIPATGFNKIKKAKTEYPWSAAIYDIKYGWRGYEGRQ